MHTIVKPIALHVTRQTRFPFHTARAYNDPDDCRPIFSAPRSSPMKPAPVSIRYVEEMMDAATDLAQHDRYDFLSIHGIDLDRVNMYLNTVKNLDEAWELPVHKKAPIKIEEKRRDEEWLDWISARLDITETDRQSGLDWMG